MLCFSAAMESLYVIQLGSACTQLTASVLFNCGEHLRNQVGTSEEILKRRSDTRLRNLLEGLT